MATKVESIDEAALSYYLQEAPEEFWVTYISREIRAVKKIRALVLHRAKKVCFVPSQKSLKSRIREIERFLRDIHIHAGGVSNRLFEITNELIHDATEVRKMRSVSSLVRKRHDMATVYETKTGTNQDFNFEFGDTEARTDNLNTNNNDGLHNADYIDPLDMRHRDKMRAAQREAKVAGASPNEDDAPLLSFAELYYDDYGEDRPIYNGQSFPMGTLLVSEQAREHQYRSRNMSTANKRKLEPMPSIQTEREHIKDQTSRGLMSNKDA